MTQEERLTASARNWLLLLNGCALSDKKAAEMKVVYTVQVLCPHTNIQIIYTGTRNRIRCLECEAECIA